MKQDERKALRQQILVERNSLSIRAQKEKSIAVASRVMAMEEMASARTLFVYMHFRSEVQTGELLRRLLETNRTVVIPYIHPGGSQMSAVRITDPGKQVVPGSWGIPEPLPELAVSHCCDPGKIDMVIVPGSVFDRFGGRLGYGGGYYDRFLSEGASRAVRVAIAFELQMVDRVPVEPHDQYMDFVVTEENLYDCRRNRYAENSCISQ